MSGVSSQLAYVITNPVKGEDANLSPIIFLHGLTGSKEHWVHIAPLVANATRRKAYALDSRNHGDNEWIDDFSFEMNVDDLFHFMDTHNIPKAVIIGHSMGGITAIRAALQKPERFEKVIVEDMLVRNAPREYVDMITTYGEKAHAALESLPNNLDEVQVKRFLMDFSTQNMPDEMKKVKKSGPHDADAIILKRKSDGRYTFKANIPGIVKAMRKEGRGMSEPKGSYDGPACFIYGELSPLPLHKEEEHIKQFFPNAEFVCVKGATHLVHFDCPTEFTDAVLQFLSKND